MLTPVTLTAVWPVFVTVTFCGALFVPTFCDPKFNCAGETVSVVPVPLSSMTCGLLEALSLSTSRPVFKPITVGWKTTDTVHFAPGATLVPHVVLLPT